ncbi:MAG: hypothetical protein LBN19_01555 [Endomicrobium sp.]|jgi:hypothetical protein|nr:hypothetical protein [Endomicrobium sp.]
MEYSYLVKIAVLKSKKLNIKERQERIMNFRAVRDTIAELREQARNFELEAVADY